MARTYQTTAVATEEAQPLLPPPRKVRERVLENVAAGFGVFALSIAIAVARGVQLESYQWPALFGLAWFGLLSTIRFSLDEAKAIVLAFRVMQWRRWYEEEAKLHAETKRLLDEKSRQLSGATSQLNASVAPTFVPAKPPNDDPVLTDARTLVALRYEKEIDVSRRFMAKKPGHAWEESRYGAAMQLLKNAGIYGRGGWQTFGSADEALRLLSPAQSEVV